MTHEEKVMRWFKSHKYLDRAQAMSLGIWNLTALISVMRSKGIAIESDYPKKKDGKKANWCRYRLGE